MEAVLNKQQTYHLNNGIIFSSQFESGNLANVISKDNNTYHLWVEADPASSYKTWFYFSVEGIPMGASVTFMIMNMSNQLKLIKEGHLPVFRSEQECRWARILQPIQQNGMVKAEQGFQLTFKHTFMNKSKHFFAFSYPWTYSQNNQMIRCFIDKLKDKYHCDYRRLCLTSRKVELNILTVTKFIENNSVQMKEIKNIEDFQCFTFKNKKGIFVSARVHPGEVAASHILNGFIKQLFSGSEEAQRLLEHFVFYIIPMVNPDGVIQGNFRCDSNGKNLNRFYTNPSPQQQPQIYSIKSFLVDMIKAKHIHFCLDLHAHVNKQGAFIYGNSSGSLKEQLSICLFPKLLQYNCRYFDYDSCNFSQKNMSSKDKSDDLSKEGASRVAIYKETGLPSCWTLECNYNSCKFSNIRPKAIEQQPSSKSISNGVLSDTNYVPKKEQIIFLNIDDFEEIGTNIAQTILDYYHLRRVAPYFNSRLKNSVNFQLSLSINILRMIPFRFDNESRKILNSINSNQCLNENFGKILQKIGQDSISQYTSSKSMKEKSLSKHKEQVRVQSLRNIKEKVSTEPSRQKRETKVKTTVERDKLGVKKIIIGPLLPNIPRIPKKK